MSPSTWRKPDYERALFGNASITACEENSAMEQQLWSFMQRNKSLDTAAANCAPSIVLDRQGGMTWTLKFVRGHVFWISVVGGRMDIRASQCPIEHVSVPSPPWKEIASGHRARPSAILHVTRCPQWKSLKLDNAYIEYLQTLDGCHLPVDPAMYGKSNTFSYAFDYFQRKVRLQIIALYILHLINYS